MVCAKLLRGPERSARSFADTLNDKLTRLDCHGRTLAAGFERLLQACRAARKRERVLESLYSLYILLGNLRVKYSGPGP
jgi:hypothetical protein